MCIYIYVYRYVYIYRCIYICIPVCIYIYTAHSRALGEDEQGHAVGRGHVLRHPGGYKVAVLRGEEERGKALTPTGAGASSMHPYSIIHSFIRSFVRSFIHSFTFIHYNGAMGTRPNGAAAETKVFRLKAVFLLATLSRFKETRPFSYP